MRRVRLLVWTSVAVLVVCSVGLAAARSRRMDHAERALERAQRLLQQGDQATAAQVLTRLLREQPRCSRAHALLADVRSAQGQDAQALEHYRALADLEPQDAQACYDLVACCVAVRRYDVAERYLARWLLGDPCDTHARRLLAFVREQRGHVGRNRITSRAVAGL
ncbi:MAG TPA: tetratricopeptide repeat protein [Armatimonadota bacterium]|nr:tetratricopeptide repeat protein [Armatimonadota bacterium]